MPPDRCPFVLDSRRLDSPRCELPANHRGRCALVAVPPLQTVGQCPIQTVGQGACVRHEGHHGACSDTMGGSKRGARGAAAPIMVHHDGPAPGPGERLEAHVDATGRLGARVVPMVGTAPTPTPPGAPTPTQRSALAYLAGLLESTAAKEIRDPRTHLHRSYGAIVDLLGLERDARTLPIPAWVGGHPDPIVALALRVVEVERERDSLRDQLDDACDTIDRIKQPSF